MGGVRTQTPTASRCRSHPRKILEAQVNIYGLSGRQHLAFLGSELTASLSTVAVLALLLLVVRSLRTGDPFVLANARRLRRIAAVVAVGGTGASAPWPSWPAGWG